MKALPTAEPHLDEATAEKVFGAILDGETGDEEIARFLCDLSDRGETADEIAGAARALRARLIPVEAPEGAIDVCGTGGDGHHTLNVSTAVSLVVAAAGVPVAKHGNRAFSSRTGGADVLAALGLGADAPPDRLASILRETGLVFLFAPNHHPALRPAAVIRTELGFRTILNLAGPLTNPAGVRRQLAGVHDPAWLAPFATLLGRLGAERAWVVHGAGLDELTLAGETQVAALEHGRVREFRVTPEDAGLDRAPVEAIAGGAPAENAAALRALLRGQRGAYRDTVLLNTAAALIVAGRAFDLREGAALAAASIDSQAAERAFGALRQALGAEAE